MAKKQWSYCGKMKDTPYQTIRTEDGVIEGHHDVDNRWEFFGLPEDMSGVRVLDIGCNVGEVSFECHKRGADVVGVDFDSAIIRSASEVYPGPQYWCVDVNDYPNGFAQVLSHKWDVVLCLSVVHHVRPKPLAKLFRELKWKRVVFEGHEKSFNRKHDLKRFWKNNKLPGKIVYVEGSLESARKRPMWRVLKKGK